MRQGSMRGAARADSSTAPYTRASGWAAGGRGAAGASTPMATSTRETSGPVRARGAVPSGSPTATSRSVSLRRTRWWVRGCGGKLAVTRRCERAMASRWKPSRWKRRGRRACAWPFPSHIAPIDRRVLVWHGGPAAGRVATGASVPRVLVQGQPPSGRATRSHLLAFGWVITLPGPGDSGCQSHAKVAKVVCVRARADLLSASAPRKLRRPPVS
mmetsp:Transcript_50518/g.163693  ORF Transcript_50518/g.163693 Transcript_50518/m.163693 type:complete len:214 (-) Transcript_50518:34-675(-)